MFLKIKILFLIIFCLALFACKNDSNSEQELIEDDIGYEVPDQTELDSTTEILEVDAEYQGQLIKNGDEYRIQADAIVREVFENDYGTINSLEELYPELFQISRKLRADASQTSRDSILTFKYKGTSLEYRKKGDDEGAILAASLRNEIFLLPNGIHTGYSSEEVLAAFGINKKLKQEKIIVFSTKSNDQIILIFRKDDLIKIDLNPG